ncbi:MULTISPECIES: gamma-glutamylcyclotransferase family protein [Romboutsia]|uniref:AIG2-like family n=1 Tax=Romboutsia hominis TaxID=1507512 RepID=A0A2P2BRW0_9FIRM|nr:MULTISPECIES: gamma-glutamylcyclotransferase family protein [Romboutsia]MCH1960335.1 gamma-glutamylcyclotransferase [Romboutsia hominis]MCH1969231.1 gamma-glutamylcyclotransferase [Romboutsia hominis]MDB8791795.1 gamma-glutamylcyclotransferase [Romboutsia sp. 1001216sp1]MDB8794501.1 gamma-glutamylcyclotransferase [Romboutsia sp. 1001216sp1]MDB8797467.1 gamma-glutamylcyclotransferase [Romboutsia sp. 1001216sp1]
MLIDKIFVYGSLRSDMFNYEKLLKGKVSKTCKATINGNLFHLDNKGYPAVVPGDGTIIGELMELKDFDKSLKELDDLENYSEDNNINCEYLRKEIEVILKDGIKEIAYYYEYNTKALNNSEDKLIEIPHGDWKEYIISKI